MSTPPLLPPELNKGQRTLRKRAPVACLGCRKRKVRCDVACHGSPCSNCRMDGEDCSVISRRRAKELARIRRSKIESATTSCVSASTAWSDDSLCDILHQSPDLELYNAATPPPPPPPPPPPLAPPINVRPEQLCLDNPDFVDCEDDWRATDTTGSTNAPESPITENHHEPTQTSSSSRPQAKVQDVLYTYHRFLRHNDFSHLSARDFQLLDTQGCLRTPDRPIMDEFVQHYFVYVHPLLPMIDEADFWRCFEDETGVEPGVSLLLMQAMLFSACHCVCENTIVALGFSSARVARAEFYRRAKLLYDMNAECSLIALTQAALLLSYWTPPGEPRGIQPNTSWLGTAIHLARSKDAHLYQLWPNSTHRKLWKRIWWCCIIRDCILALGLRRPAQITRDVFHFESCEALSSDDFRDEIDSSKVYNKNAKTILTRVLLSVADLCVVLADLQRLPPWLDTPKQRDPDRLMAHWNDLRRIKSCLRSWLEKAEAGIGVSFKDANYSGNAQMEAVAVQVHIMYMYYHSAITSLAHQEILLVTIVIPAGNLYQALRSGYISALFNGLKDSSQSFAECILNLLKSNLIHLLPISAVAFLATPLMHHILDFYVKDEGSDVAVTKRSDRFNAMVKAMQIFQAHYDGVEWLSIILKRALQIDSSGHMSTKEASQWFQGLENLPTLYLHTAFTVDFGLSRSRFAQDSDIPACLECSQHVQSGLSQCGEDNTEFALEEDLCLDSATVRMDWQGFSSAGAQVDFSTVETSVTIPDAGSDALDLILAD